MTKKKIATKSKTSSNQPNVDVPNLTDMTFSVPDIQANQPQQELTEKFVTNIVHEVYPAGSKVIAVTAPNDEPINASLSSEQPTSRSVPNKILNNNTFIKSPQVFKNVSKTQNEDKKVVAPAKSVGEIIWNDIKDRSVAMFALSGKRVCDYAKLHNIDPKQCFITVSVGSAIPAIEETIKDKYVVEQSGKYITIRIK